MRILGKSCLWLAALCFLAPASAPAEDSYVAPGLQQFVLTDDEIATRCAASIQSKTGLIQAEDGRWLTKCESYYESMRVVSQRVSDQIQTAAKKAEENAKKCADDNTQSNCLEAGRKLASSTADSYDSLVQDLDEGLAEVASVDTKPSRGHSH